LMVATPHLYKTRSIEPGQINRKEIIFDHLALFREKLATANIPLEVLPGCDFPLGFEPLQLLAQDLALTINDARRYFICWWSFRILFCLRPWTISAFSCNPGV
jgi:tyrosine-protein phosphatase YwqE